MGIISKLGKWLDSRFPEKMTVDDVYQHLTAYAGLGIKLGLLEETVGILDKRLKGLEFNVNGHDKELKLVADEMNKAKAVLSMMNKIRTTPVMNTSEAWKR